MVLTPSQRQRRRREAGSKGGRRQNLCTEGHEPRTRLGDLGKPATYGKARHHQEGRQVHAAAVEGR